MFTGLKHKPMVLKGEEYIVAQADLAIFLTNNGFPYGRVNLSRLIQEGKGPPTNAMFGNKTLFKAKDALAWAEARCYEKKPQKGRKKPKAEQESHAVSTKSGIAPPL